MNRIILTLMCVSLAFGALAGESRSSDSLLAQGTKPESRLAKASADSGPVNAPLLASSNGRYMAGAFQYIPVSSVWCLGPIIEPMGSGGKRPRPPIQGIGPITGNVLLSTVPGMGGNSTRSPGHGLPSGDQKKKGFGFYEDIDHGGKKPRPPLKSPLPGDNHAVSSVPGMGDGSVMSPGQDKHDDNKIMPTVEQTQKAKRASQGSEMIPCEGLRVLERNTRAVVTEQPLGTVVYYQRAGKALTLSYSNYSWNHTNADQAGSMTAVINGNTIWFKNLLYDPDGYWNDYWIEGTKSGSRITIALDQDVYYSSIYNAYVRIGWGSTRLINGNLAFIRNANKTTATFTIDGDVLTLDDARFTSDYTGQGLVLYWTDDETFGGMALYNTTLTQVGEIPEPPVIYTDDDIEAMDGEWVIYQRTGYAIYGVESEEEDLELSEQKGMSCLFFEADGVHVYMRNPLYGERFGTWIKGTKEGNTLTFPMGQYVYWDDNTFLGLKTTWGIFDMNEGYTDNPDVTEVTFTIDGDHIIMNNCGIADEEQTIFYGLSLMVDSAYCDLGWYGDLDFHTVHYNIPGVPANVTVNPAATTADVAWTVGTYNSTWNVRYREWVDPSTVDYYFDDFEGESLDNWMGMDLDGDGYWWQGWESEDGNHYLGSASYINEVGVLTPDNVLLSPELTLNGVVRFNAQGLDANYAEDVFKVYLFVGDTATITDIDDFVAISEDITVTSEQTEYTFPIPEEYWGQQGYVAIRHYNVTDQYWLAIDDFFVGDSSIDDSWNYVYGVEDPAIVIDGLNVWLTYEVQVQGVNDGGVGSWTASSVFTTAYPVGLRGDVNDDGFVTIDDVAALINALLTDGWEVINIDNANCNLDESLTIDDVAVLINYLLTDQWPN